MKSLEQIQKRTPSDTGNKGRVHGRFAFQAGEHSLLEPVAGEVVNKNDHSEEWRELREKEHKAVVRVFLYQARSPELIPDDVAPKDMTFVDMILIKKGPGNNEGQLMPVGGKVDDEEPLSTAIRREVVEETHLRAIPNSIVPFARIQHYNFKHDSQEHGGTTQKHRRAYYYQGHLLPHPHDIPYVLDPEEDNIANFERLSSSQVADLFSKGKVDTVNGEGIVLDSLNANAAERAANSVEADDEDIEVIQMEALVRLQLGECEKKMQILAQLQGAFRQRAEKWDAETARALILKNRVEKTIYDVALDVETDRSAVTDLIAEVMQFWNDQMDAHGWTTADIKLALGYANARYTLGHAAEHFDYEKGKGVPTVNMIFPLLFEGKLGLKDMGLYRVIRENAQAKKLLELSQIIFLYHRYHIEDGPRGLGGEHQTNAELKLRSRLNVPEGDIDFDTVQDWMYEQGYLDKRGKAAFETLAPEVDQYFEVLQREARIEDRSIDQANEVKGKTIETILAIAFNEDQSVIRDNPEYDRLIRWEAQRKLLLVYMLHEASSLRNQVSKRGIEPVDKLEASLEADDSKVDERKLNLNGTVYDVSIEKRTKKLLSLLRKLIVRDKLSLDEDLVGDTFAESIIFNDPKADYHEVEGSIDCPITDENNQLVDTIKAPKVVMDYLQTLSRNAEAAGEVLTITKFKGLPKPGEAFSSSGPGGGAAVRMCKFYIQHRDRKGLLRQREVQMFVPNEVNGQWVSGQVDYEAKKRDDAEYAVRRLFSTKALRSFMELLFPAEVYGDSIQPIYKSRVK